MHDPIHSLKHNPSTEVIYIFHCVTCISDSKFQSLVPYISTASINVRLAGVDIIMKLAGIKMAWHNYIRALAVEQTCGAC